MSDKKNLNRPFTNEDTIVRRAWIETALEGVRGQLGSLCPDTAIAGAGISEDIASETTPDDRPQSRASETKGRPQLYVAWSAPQRRSGT